jgi:hypothetical protein
VIANPCRKRTGTRKPTPFEQGRLGQTDRPGTGDDGGGRVWDHNGHVGQFCSRQKAASRVRSRATDVRKSNPSPARETGPGRRGGEEGVACP